MKSMTGFGKAEYVYRGRKVQIELKSLNSKQFDLNIKLPSLYRNCELQLRNQLLQAFQRGKVDCAVYTDEYSGDFLPPINKEVIRLYLQQIQEATNELGLQSINMDSILHSILTMPEVKSTYKPELSEEETELFLNAIDKAAEELNKFRQQEGVTLQADLLNGVEHINELLSQVDPYEAERIIQVRERLQNQLDTLTVTIDPARLEQELIYYLEKLDIHEEKVRLQHHCDYFKEVLQSEDDKSIGKSLGFITQEMGREINTLGSKANHIAIQKLVVAMKDELERLKEQILNVL